MLVFLVCIFIYLFLEASVKPSQAVSLAAQSPGAVGQTPVNRLRTLSMRFFVCFV